MKSSDRHRVLYAEDNEDCSLMVSLMCEFSNIEVVTTNTVSRAWQLAQSENFDLYLLESWFPDGNGWDLCRRLRSFAPHTPILFYSTNAYESDRKNGLAAGADDYLPKPYLADLTVTIRQAIERTGKSARLTQTHNA